MRNRFGVFATLSMSNGQHVQSVIVVRILVADKSEVRDRFVVSPPVQREGRRIEPLVDCLWSGIAGCFLPPADIEVKPDTLMELLLLGVKSQDRLEELNGCGVVMALDSFQASFIERNRLEITRPSRRRRWGTRRGCGAVSGVAGLGIHHLPGFDLGRRAALQSRRLAVLGHQSERWISALTRSVSPA
jgi:hypothetical protein